MTSKPIYITPLVTVHTTLDDVDEAVARDGLFLRSRDENLAEIPTLARGKRTLIVGEPGAGKSLMMEKLAEELRTSGIAVSSVALRAHDAAARIRTFTSELLTGLNAALLLDGLDEAPPGKLQELIQEVSAVSDSHPQLAVFIAGRWVFVKRYARAFSAYRVAIVHLFTQQHVRQYLAQAGRDKREVEQLIQLVSFDHRTIILQVPRYLCYVVEYIEARGADAARSLSRNDLFEYFIYRKLDLEDKKLSADKRALTKRVLEKIALVMEIFQSNVITSDELMTVLDELHSDLKITALSQIGIEVFYDFSSLKVSQDALDKVSFENTEFQEYLAAKEISRFADPNQSAYELAVDKDANEIRPSWFNTLTFLTDIRPELLGPFTEHSGLLREDARVIDESFFVFLSRLNPNAIDAALRRQLFLKAIEYHTRMLQWLPYRLATALPAYFEPSLEPFLKAHAAAAEIESEDKRFVPLANLAEVIGSLVENRAQVDRPFWLAKLIAYAHDHNKNGVLQRHALSAIADFGDPSAIDALADVPQTDELITRELIRAVIELDPDHPVTLDIVFDGVKSNDIYARRGLYRMRKAESVRGFLARIATDNDFCQGMLEGLAIFREEDVAIAKVIKSVISDEIRELGKQALVAMMHYDFAHRVQQSLLLPALWKVLGDGEPDFAAEMVRRIRRARDGLTSLFFARHLFAETLGLSDAESFFAAMREANDVQGAMHVMDAVRQSGRPDADAVYEAGRAVAEDDYAKWEAQQAAASASGAANQPLQEMLAGFRARLEPSPGKFSQDVFDFYNRHRLDLEPMLEKRDRDRLRKLITDTVFKWDPAEHKLSITVNDAGGKTFTTSTAVNIFEEAAVTARALQIDIAPYRAEILSLIPFAHSSELQTIFALVPRIDAGDLGRVLEVYEKRDSDLWRHRPESLVEAARRYHAVEAVPVLRALVAEDAIDRSTREQALLVAESLAPDATFLQATFARHVDAPDDQSKLAEAANAALITSHADPLAIRWRLAALAARAAPLEHRTRRGRRLSSIEGEVTITKSFAQPLMKVTQRGYEEDYLRLFEAAVDLWARGEAYYPYAQYVWDTVYAYFENLRQSRSYEPLRLLEAKVAQLANRPGGNWAAARMVSIRRAYLESLGKPLGISDAVARYNKVRLYSSLAIRTSSDLFHHIRDAIDTDLRRWIEGEGAYRMLALQTGPDGKRHRDEELIQRTVKTQFDNVLLRRGLQVDIVREPQLLDGKRADFLVRYGFVGPIVIEIKLTSNTDLRGRKLASSPSYQSMRRYMDGYGARHGIFLVFNNTSAGNLADIVSVFETITGVRVQTLDCMPAKLVQQRPSASRAPTSPKPPKPPKPAAPKPPLGGKKR